MKAKQVVIDDKQFWTILLTIVALSFALKLVRLSFPEKFYFDEVYHAYTAGLYVQNNTDAYNIYAKNPQGVAVEWTHPPTAKLLMAGSMLIFGNNSFGWRFSSTIFGSLVILFTGLLAWQIFESRFLALMAAFLLSIENLLFAQSRIAMNDTHLLAFILLSLYFFVRWRKDQDNTKLVMYSGLSLGLALSCKWSALFVYFILFLERMASWWKSPSLFPTFGELRKLVIAFLVIPPLVYLLSYAHFFWMGYSWDELIRMQQNMWWYHTNLKASHPYMSVPYQWLLNLKPVWMNVDYSRNQEGLIANIYNTGNSFILYFGLVAVIMTIKELWQKGWNWKLWFALACYFMVWVPWLRSPRIMLFYHYLPALPMLCILLARSLEQQWLKGRKSAVITFCTLSFLWFGLFYPHNTGLHLPSAFVKTVYYFMPTWNQP